MLVDEHRQLGLRRTVERELDEVPGSDLLDVGVPGRIGVDRVEHRIDVVEVEADQPVVGEALVAEPDREPDTGEEGGQQAASLQCRVAGVERDPAADIDALVVERVAVE